MSNIFSLKSVPIKLLSVFLFGLSFFLVTPTEVDAACQIGELTRQQPIAPVVGILTGCGNDLSQNDSGQPYCVWVIVSCGSGGSTSTYSSGKVWNGSSCVNRTWTNYCTSPYDANPNQNWRVDNTSPSPVYERVNWNLCCAPGFVKSVSNCIVAKHPAPRASYTCNTGGN